MLGSRRGQNPGTDHEVVVSSHEPETGEDKHQPDEDGGYAYTLLDDCRGMWRDQVEFAGFDAPRVSEEEWLAK